MLDVELEMTSRRKVVALGGQSNHLHSLVSIPPLSRKPFTSLTKNASLSVANMGQATRSIESVLLTWSEKCGRQIILTPKDNLR